MNGAGASRSEGSGERGQVAVLFALMAVVLVGMVGLVVDGGTGYIHSRTLQEVADTAAESGDVLLTADLKALGANPPTAEPYTTAQICSAIEASVAAAGPGSTNVGSFAAYFTNSDGTSLGVSICSSTAPLYPPTSPLATGISVTPANTHPTFFMGALGINNVAEASNGTAVVQQVNVVQEANLAPFIAWYLDCQMTNQPPLAVGDTEVLRSSTYISTSLCGPGMQLTSNDFKGYLHWHNGSVTIGTTNGVTSEGGNAIGTSDLSVLQAAALSGTPIVFPVADVISGSGSAGTNLGLTLSGFVEMTVQAPVGNGASSSWIGTVVGVGVIPFSAENTVCTSTCTYPSTDPTQIALING